MRRCTDWVPSTGASCCSVATSTTADSGRRHRAQSGRDHLSLAGEDLASAIGHHPPEIADIDGLGPYFEAQATAHIGCRPEDEHVAEMSDLIGLTVPAARVILHGGVRAAAQILTAPGLERGFWLHVDVDVLDPEHMPAVDSPDPGGLAPDELIALLRGLAPRAWGASVTVFDPDLDSDGAYAETVARAVEECLGELGRDAFESR
ncbi:arginase family protein [Microbacterium sp. AK031]|uniref:arginase family protein n=1 Tax=Microbacterium sp. AK031 TaxID=2723076 RepID=UPI0021675369|nr:arginase family protein [Microbacterium sp. AK031]MCS3842606.1 arginase family enzyme [Microbacterium sp. AK031]